MNQHEKSQNSRKIASSDATVCSVVSFGGGVNSTAMLVALEAKGEKPDHIIFADTGGEKPETYEHVERMQKWLASKEMPEITIVKEGRGLEEDCIERDTLPGKAFGFGSCSERFKVRPQRRWIKQQGITNAVWLVGIHAGEAKRALRTLNQRDDVRFPLIEWGWSQDHCVKAIVDAGLLVPVKSACFFCPSMRKVEVIQLSKESPELFQRAVEMEENPMDIMSGSWQREGEELDRPAKPLSGSSYCSSLRAAGFIRNKWDGYRRFMIRQLNGEWQVYGWHIEHVAMCSTREDAEMVRDGLEALADATGIKEPTND